MVACLAKQLCRIVLPIETVLDRMLSVLLLSIERVRQQMDQAEVAHCTALAHSQMVHTVGTHFALSGYAGEQGKKAIESARDAL